MFLIPCLPVPSMKHTIDVRKKSEEYKQRLENEKNKLKLNDALHTKLFTPDMSGKFEIYLAHIELPDDKKKQLLKELAAFAERVEKIINE